ncbi:MAG: hypothetical protein DRP55_02290 [Spirochaetes bacterium]|nr:MAG: hypothetical protein DRP55_02290 [Spirochaetota bacterium]
MICQYCQKNEATYHLQKIINNSIVEIHLCHDCSKKELRKKHENGIEDKINTILEGLIKSDTRIKENNNAVFCGVCGTTYADFEKKGLFGCSECYISFRGIIKSKYIADKKVEYNEKKLTEKKHSKIDILELELKKAVELEDFERAAILRDKINQCRKRFLT